MVYHLRDRGPQNIDYGPQNRVLMLSQDEEYSLYHNWVAYDFKLMTAQEKSNIILELDSIWERLAMVAIREIWMPKPLSDLNLSYLYTFVGLRTAVLDGQMSVGLDLYEASNGSITPNEISMLEQLNATIKNASAMKNTIPLPTTIRLPERFVDHSQRNRAADEMAFQ